MTIIISSRQGLAAGRWAWYSGLRVPNNQEREMSLTERERQAIRDQDRRDAEIRKRMAADMAAHRAMRPDLSVARVARQNAKKREERANRRNRDLIEKL